LEKLLKEHDAKLAEADKDAVRKAIERTREAAKTNDRDKIKSAINELEQASHALSKTLYSTAGAQAAGAASGAGGGPQAAPSGAAPGDDEDTIDAEFEVKD
ncbi:MAG: molecular chaperone DnaK, partial [Planctomycetia bacterium]|nr:molecular chaperone DnaK [Planctomycetia bacterium]